MALSSPAAAPPMSKRLYFQLAIVLGVLTAFGPLSIDMYLPGLPSIAEEFGVTTAMAQQTLSVFFIGLAAGQMIYGPLADRFGRRLPLFIGSVLYTLACIGCAMAPSLDSLILLRLGQAMGGCSGMVVSLSVVRDFFDRRESARMYSFLMLVMGLAPVTAPLIGGQLLIHFGWRAIFYLLVVYGITTLLLVAFALPESLPEERRSRAGFGAVVRNYGKLLIDPRFMGFTLAGGLSSAAMFAYISGSPFVFIELNGVAPDHYGLIFGANAVGLVVAAQLNRWLLQWYGTLQILRAALSISAFSGIVLVLVTITGWGGFPGMLVALFFSIATTGLVNPNAMAAAMEPFGSTAGSASAMIGATRFLLGSLASALVGLFDNGTALPMVGAVAACAAGGWLILYLFAMHRVPATTG